MSLLWSQTKKQLSFALPRRKCGHMSQLFLQKLILLYDRYDISTVL